MDPCGVQVSEDDMKLGARQTHPSSQVPMLPSVETRSMDSLRHSTGVLMTSGAVKLPLLHDKHLSATDALLAAATAASRSTGSLRNPWSTSTRRARLGVPLPWAAALIGSPTGHTHSGLLVPLATQIASLFHLWFLVDDELQAPNDRFGGFSGAPGGLSCGLNCCSVPVNTRVLFWCFLRSQDLLSEGFVTGKSVTLLVPTSMLLLSWHLQNFFCQDKHTAKLEKEPSIEEGEEEEMSDPQVSDEQV
eukprot:Skav210869  [mRNA]  locus=scaffold7397:1496:3730:+ [translate_table: standard]